MLFPKTHDLTDLGELCTKANPALGELVGECAGLTNYAVVFRYIDAPYEPDEAEALDALQKAQRLFDEVKAALGL